MAKGDTPATDWFLSILLKLVKVKQEEIQPLLWSFSYFFVLLCSYYILRPLRDEMGIAGGVENLQWLFTGTFVAMLVAVPMFGWISSRYPRKQFLPLVYLFFISNLLIFYFLFYFGWSYTWIARSFFIWTSVFNLFIVSVFWSFMADLFNDNQARRLFGFVAAGGTAGALAGPTITVILAAPLGTTNLLLISVIGLVWAILSIHRLNSWNDKNTASVTSPSPQILKSVKDTNPALGGGVFDGLRMIMTSPYLFGICLLILLYTTLSTFLYFQQAQIIHDSFSDAAQRTTVFAAMDLATNALTIFFQFFLTSRIIKLLGLGWALALIPLLLSVGFLALAFVPTLGVMVCVQVARRSGNYALMKPAREILFVVLDKEQKYKAKNIIDTVIYRSGDVVSAWVYAGLQALGLGLAAIALIAVPLCGAWAWISYRLGKQQKLQANEKEMTT
ncbi:ATP:ADP antiporter, AAA family [Desulfuromusa kysingii]|uniref:ATP:ADP antiporter, AAA family n=1 Tax=Desulfuromusa kysingii TaxID=37625 RepID=A0A1H4DRL1_9BACT|nr:Npt1/Npt2 family nucleotide transporter [Desulfuromusa kysingii]SEA75403.1 ATP:ADP antiporter, AAA family [Desulfuromusa kysingii]